MIFLCSYQFYLYCLVHIVAVQAVALRLDWQTFRDDAKSVEIQKIIINSNIIREIPLEEFQILEFSNIKENPESSLLLCKVELIALRFEHVFIFYGAITTSSDGQIILNTIGGLHHIIDGTPEEIICKNVKKIAEKYSETLHAFQQHWQCSEVLKSHVETNNVNPYFYPEDGTIDHCGIKYTIHKFWFVEPHTRMVGIYKCSEDETAAIVTSELKENGVVVEQIIGHESVLRAFESVPVHLESELAFVPGWTRDQKTLQNYEELTSKVHLTVAWLPIENDIHLYAVNVDKETLGTMYVLSDTYPVKGICVIWKKLDNGKYSFRHAGTIENIADAAVEYNKFKLECRSSFTESEYGVVGWFKVDGVLQLNQEKILNSIEEKTKVDQSHTDLLAFQLLPYYAGDDDTRMMDIWFLLKVNETIPYYTIAHTQLKNSESGNALEMDLTKVMEYIEKRHENPARAIMHAKEIISTELTPTAFHWENAIGKDFTAEIMLTREFGIIPETGIRLVPTMFCQIDKSKLLLIIECTADAKQDEDGIEDFFYVAFNKFSEDGLYRVTWIGSPIQIRSRSGHSLFDVKQQAQVYTLKIFAFKEVWTNVTTTSIDAEKEEIILLKEWQFSKEKLIQIHCASGSGRLNYYFQAMANPKQGIYITTGMVGQKFDTLAEVFDDLLESFPEAGLFLTSPEETLTSEMHTKMMNLKRKIEQKNGVTLVFESLRYASLDAQKLVIIYSIHTDAEMSVPPTQTTENFDIGTQPAENEHEHTDDSATKWALLVPVKDTENAFIIGGKIRKIEITDDFEEDINMFVFDPLVFAGVLDLKNEHFDENETELILDAAAWNVDDEGEISVIMARNTESAKSDANAYVMCLESDDDSPCFFLVYNKKSELDPTQRIKYIGGLGTHRDARNEYLQYVKSMHPFQEETFRNGIGWYNADLKKFTTMRKSFFDFIGTQPRKVDKISVTGELFSKWKIGRISKRVENIQTKVTSYALVGPVETELPTKYISAVIEVLVLHGEVEFKSVVFGKARGSHKHAEHDLYDYVALQHVEA